MEWQADKLGSDLLMPSGQVKIAYYLLRDKTNDMITMFSEQFNVSKQTMEINRKPGISFKCRIGTFFAHNVPLKKNIIRRYNIVTDTKQNNMTRRKLLLVRCHCENTQSHSLAKL